jgi:hypothetical protein
LASLLTSLTISAGDTTPVYCYYAILQLPVELTKLVKIDSVARRSTTTTVNSLTLAGGLQQSERSALVSFAVKG